MSTAYGANMRRRWASTSKPLGSIELDLRNPIARKAVNVVPLTQPSTSTDLQSLSAGGYPTIAELQWQRNTNDNVAVPAYWKDGPALYVNNDTNWAIRTTTSINLTSDWGELERNFSLFFRATSTGPPLNSPRFFYHNGSWEYRWAADSNNRLICEPQTAGGSTQLLFTPTLNVPFTYVDRFYNYTGTQHNWDALVNGRIWASQLETSQADSTNDLEVGYRSGTSGSWLGYFHTFGIFRSLTSGEAQSLSLNPYQIFKERRPVTYSFPKPTTTPQTIPEFKDWTTGVNNSNLSSVAITYPSTLQEKDLLVCWYTVDGPENIGGFDTEGWTVFDTFDNARSTGGSGNEISVECAYIYDPPTSKANQTFNVSHTSEQSTWAIARIGGAKNPIEAPINLSINTPSTSVTDAELNPVAVDKGNYLVLSFVGADGFDGITGFPTGYGNTGSAVCNNAGGVQTGYASKEVTGITSANPDKFVIGNSQHLLTGVFTIPGLLAQTTERVIVTTPKKAYQRKTRKIPENYGHLVEPDPDNFFGRQLNWWYVPHFYTGIQGENGATPVGYAKIDSVVSSNIRRLEPNEINAATSAKGITSFTRYSKHVGGVVNVLGMRNTSSNTSGYQLAETSTSSWPTWKSNNSFTIATLVRPAHFKLTAAGSGDARFFSVDKGAADGDKDLSITEVGDDSWRVQARINGTLYTATASLQMDLVADNFVALKYNGANVRITTILEDGTITAAASASATGGYSAQSDTGISMMSSYSTADTQIGDGLMYYIFGFDGYLSSEELAILYKDPWQVFRSKRSPVTYSFPASNDHVEPVRPSITIPRGIRSTTQVTQPQADIRQWEIDEKHPYARDMRAALFVDPHGNLFDVYRRQEVAVTHLNSPTLQRGVTGLYGWGYNGTNSYTQITSDVATSFNLDMNDWRTMLNIVGTRSGVRPGDDDVIVSIAHDTDGDPKWELHYEQDTTKDFWQGYHENDNGFFFNSNANHLQGGNITQNGRQDFVVAQGTKQDGAGDIGFEIETCNILGGSNRDFNRDTAPQTLASLGWSQDPYRMAWGCRWGSVGRTKEAPLNVYATIFWQRPSGFYDFLRPITVNPWQIFKPRKQITYSFAPITTGKGKIALPKNVRQRESAETLALDPRRLRVDEENSIAKKLNTALKVLPNGKIWDIVKGTQPGQTDTAGGGSISVVRNAKWGYGKSYDKTGGDPYTTFTDLEDRFQDLGKSLTLAVAWENNAQMTGSTSSDILWGIHSSDASWSAWRRHLTQDNDVSDNQTVKSAWSDDVAGIVITPGTWGQTDENDKLYIAIGSFNVNSNGYVDAIQLVRQPTGVWETWTGNSGASAVRMPPASSIRISWNVDNDDTPGGTGHHDIYATWSWERALSMPEMVSFAKNPFQVFTTPTIRQITYSFPAATEIVTDPTPPEPEGPEAPKLITSIYRFFKRIIGWQ